MKELIILFLSIFLLNACVLEYSEPILKESKTIEIPNVSGAYKNNEGDTYTIKLVKDTTNTFLASPPDEKTPIKIILEPLKSTGNYLAQLQNPEGNDVIFSLVQITKTSIKVYIIKPKKPEAFTELANKHNIKFVENSRLIKSFQSLNDLKAFADLAFSNNFSEELFELKLSK